MTAVEVSRNAGDRNYHAPANRVAGGHHVIRGFSKGLVQAMISPVWFLGIRPSAFRSVNDCE